MSDLPILFSAPMVRAILREIEQPGTGKTQTRRVLTADCDEPPAFIRDGVVTAYDEYDRAYRWPRTKAVGDRLYVREAHHRTNDHPDSHLVGYDFAEGPTHRKGRHHIEGVGHVEFFHHSLGGWGGRLSRNYPGMHMPRWASRITLIVTDIRVQRVREISTDDCLAEGIEANNAGLVLVDGSLPLTAKAAYRALWDSLNAARGYGWDANPWVAAYTFRPILGNIDQISNPSFNPET